jgi:hypothetical protein
LKRVPKIYGKRNFYVFDVETKVEDDGTHRFLFAYVLEYRYSKKFENLPLDERIKKSSKFHFFKTKTELTRFLFGISKKEKSTRIKKIKKKSTRFIIGHNITYDIEFVDLEIARKEGFELKKFMQNPNYWVFYHKEKDIRVVFVDTFNFYKTSLEKLFPNQKIKIDFSTYDYKDLTLLKRRCKMDVFLTCKLAFDLKGISASDLAFKSFREEKGIYIQKIETPVAKESYYGGRVECYINNIRIENVKYYDFNSLYPSVMKGNLIPIKYIQTLENPSLEFVQELIKRNFFIFAEVEVEVPSDEKIPPFPFRGKDKKLYFPTGRFTTFLAQPEIVLGLELGYIKKFVKVEQYYAKKVFDNYVDKYYELRQKNPDKKEFYKLHLNSLYGKFGQREHLTSIINTDDTSFTGLIEIEGEKYYICKGFGFKSQVTEKRKYNVAVASSITSYARVKLYRTLKEINFNVVYVDTDSIFTTENLGTSKELGKLKLECEGTFLGFRAKCYIIEDKVKFKGGRVSLELLKNCGEEISVEMKKFPTLKEYIKNGGVVKTLKVVKKFNLVDDKRKGKGITRPFDVKELIEKWEK